MRKNQEIESGDNSINVQGEQVTLNQNYAGISYLDVKEIAMDVFKSNFYDLGKQVDEIVYKRAESIINKYLEKLSLEDPNLIKNTKDPDVRYVIYETQKNHARRGDEEIEDLLVNLLIERTKTSNESFKKLVLNEALEIIPKLNSNQLNILSLIFLTEHLNFIVPMDINVFTSTIKKIDIGRNTIDNQMIYRHLQYAGCLSISIGSMQYDEIICNKFPQINNEKEANEIISSNQYLNLLRDMWNNSTLCNCTLTSVGIAVALSYVKIKTGLDVDLEIWIKE